MATKFTNNNLDAQVVPSLQNEDGTTLVVSPGETVEVEADLSALAAFDQVPDKPEKSTAKAKTSEEQ